MFELLLNNFFLWANIVLVAVFMLYQVINNKKYSIKEFFIQIGVTVIGLIAVMSLIYFLGTNIYRTEFLSSKVKIFKYEEPWTEKYDCSEEKCITDSKGKRSCHTVKKTCTTRHYEDYYIVDNFNSEIKISEAAFINARTDFGAIEQHVNRSSQTSISRLRGEGDIWISYPSKIISVTKKHKYINYLMGSKETIQKRNGNIKYSVLSYPKLLTNRYGPIKINRLIGYSNKKLEKELDLLATEVGFKKQINPMIYVTDKGRDFKESLEIAWSKANKNDSVLILGIKNKKIVWSDSLNWSENERFGLELERDFIGLSIDNSKDIIGRYKSIINKYWKRKSMEETYGYLKTEIEIPWYLQGLFVLLNIVGNFFLHRYFLKNDI